MGIQYRASWAEVDLAKIQRNYKKLNEIVIKPAKLMPVVKADAYGHGSVEVARALSQLGADFFAVASLDEALELRAGGIQEAILVFGYMPKAGYARAREAGISVTIVDSASFNELAEFITEEKQETNKKIKSKAKLQDNIEGNEVKDTDTDIEEGERKKLRIHLKLDSGMSRLGYTSLADFARDMTRLLEDPVLDRALVLEGCYSHLASADASDKKTNEEQVKCFAAYLDIIRDYELQTQAKVIIHLANSAGLIDSPELSYDYVRPGIALYGHYPSAHINQSRVELEPAMTLKSQIAQIKVVKAGSCIGYGWTHRLERDSMLAIIPIGYADGYNRLLSNCGQVLIRGRRCPVVGRVCMDLIMVDVTDLDERDLDDEVVLFGRQGEAEISVTELADLVGTISYELLCAISKRIPRMYK